jgi:hypothetical protein
MAIGDSRTVAVTTANKIGLVIFDGTGGQRISLKVSTIAVTSYQLYIKDPFGSDITALSGTFIDAKVLPVTGTYTILFDPVGTHTGSITFTLYNIVDVVGSIAIGGSSFSATTTTPGQNGRVTFNGSAGQRVSLGVSSVSFPTNGSSVEIYNPDGTLLASDTNIHFQGDAIDINSLPVTGTYTVVANPKDDRTGSMTLTVSEEVTGTVATGGETVTVTIDRPGQNARFTFSGTAGQRISLGMSTVTFPTGGSSVTIYNPDGTGLASDSSVSSTGDAIDIDSLPVTGTYAIFVNPELARTGSMALTLSEDVTGSIAIGAPPLTVTIDRPGQRARSTFSGNSGQRISLKFTAVTFPTGGSAVYIYKPDGALLASDTNISGSGDFIDTQSLLATGSYTILIDPYGARTGSMTLTLYDVPADVTGAVAIGGSSTTLTITTPGQNAQLTFDGTSGQQATVRITANTISSVTVKLLKPDGTQLTSSTSSSSSFNLATQTLPTAGTYTIIIDPGGANIGSLSVSVTSP